MDRGCYDYPRTNVRKIWEEIQKTLLSYLNVEESLEKIEQKKKLEVLINCFLGQVHHSKKFTFIETADVLRKSVMGLPELPFYKINAAWTALINYAQHLVVQPWRKEFREIKTYCGYYKHHIGESLIRGEIILELMGYREICEGTLILEGPVDPDRVTCVMRDAFIALVECQIMRYIYEELINYHNNLSWCDILRYRETFPGPPEMAIQELKLYSPRYSYFRPTDFYPKRPEHYPYAYSQPRYHPCLPPAPVYGGVLGPPQTLPPNYTVYPPMNGYTYRPPPHDCQPVPSSYCSVPTGQLIELETSHENNDSAYCGASSHKRYDYSTESRVVPRANEDYSGKKFKSKDVIDGTYERKYGAPRTSLNVNDYGVASCSESMKNLRLDETSTDSSIEKRSPLRSHDFKNGVRLKNKDGGLSLGQAGPQTVADSLKPRKGDNEVWSCTVCTYINDVSKKVCDMCDKSRFQDSVLQPLEIGGRECGHCTLVNLKGTTSCAACGESLQDSSTYI